MQIETNDLIKKIHKIMIEIRQATPRKENISWSSPSDLVCREDYLYDKKVNAASMTLFPTGCEYALTGGCTMCGEWAGSNLGELVSAQFHVAQFASGSAKLFSENEIEWLRIYQEGSFLNDKEVTPEAREIILHLASNFSRIKRVTIETRPEYLTENIAATIRNFTKNVELEIGIGLEAKNDFIRNVCIGKGTKLQSYEKSVKIARQHEIIPLAYIILKPPFLSEGEAIKEAIESTQYAFEIGFEEVYIQAASIHEWSLSELLAANGLYFPPWLWSMIEAVKQTAHLGKVKIGGLEYFPRPAFISQNYKDLETHSPCDCSESVWQLIQNFNAYGDVNVFSNVKCSCQQVWQSSTQEVNISLESRVSEILSTISSDEYIKFKRKGVRN